MGGEAFFVFFFCLAIWRVGGRGEGKGGHFDQDDARSKVRYLFWIGDEGHECYVEDVSR